MIRPPRPSRPSCPSLPSLPLRTLSTLLSVLLLPLISGFSAVVHRSGGFMFRSRFVPRSSSLSLFCLFIARRSSRRATPAPSPVSSRTRPAACCPAHRSKSSTTAEQDQRPDSDHGAATAPTAPSRWPSARTASTGRSTGSRRRAPDRAAAGQTATTDVTLSPARFSQSVVVTARRVEEVAQDVPIPVSVVRGDLVSDAGAFNVNRLKEMIPTVQFYSTNPRNSAINIRGLGAPFGLTNDGTRAGRRPVHRRRVLRASGVGDARLPRRRSGRSAARSGGHALRKEHDRRRHQRHHPQAELHARHRSRSQLRQLRSSCRRRRRSPARCAKTLAGRLSFSGTQRDGTVYNVTTARTSTT